MNESMSLTFLETIFCSRYEAKNAVKYAIRYDNKKSAKEVISCAVNYIYKHNKSEHTEFTPVLNEHLKSIVADQFIKLILTDMVLQKNGSWFIADNCYPTLKEDYYGNI